MITSSKKKTIFLGAQSSLRPKHDLTMRPKIIVDKRKYLCMQVIRRANLGCTKDVNILGNRLAPDWPIGKKEAIRGATKGQHVQKKFTCATRPAARRPEVHKHQQGAVDP